MGTEYLLRWISFTYKFCLYSMTDVLTVKWNSVFIYVFLLFFFFFFFFVFFWISFPTKRTLLWRKFTRSSRLIGPDTVARNACRYLYRGKTFDKWRGKWFQIRGKKRCFNKAKSHHWDISLFLGWWLRQAIWKRRRNFAQWVRKERYFERTTLSLEFLCGEWITR